MVGSGVPITIVKDTLGHSDIHTTMRYAHAITEQTLSAVETLSNYVEKNNKVISVFNDKVAKYGWQPVSTTATVVGKHGESNVEMNSVDIEEQAEAMTKLHFNIES